MPRERPRLSSRRGGSRGRSATQRPVNSPSSSMNRSNMRGWGEIPDCGHVEHPAVRYRIPCTLENNTLIVSVMVEHCTNLRGPLDNLNVSGVDMQVPAVDMRRPIIADSPQATHAADTGPSAPVQRSLCSDMEESQKLKGPAKDEPQTTDED